MSIDINDLICTPEQEKALISRGWTKRFHAEVIPMCHNCDASCNRHVISNNSTNVNELRDWAYAQARKQQDHKVWIDFSCYWYHLETSTTGIDWRIVYERRIVEYGMHVNVLGCNDVMPEIPAGLHMGMYHLISAKRLCRALGIGANGKREKKSA